MAGVEKPAAGAKTDATKPHHVAQTNVGILAYFVNALLDNFDKPNGLYNAIKQEKTLRERLSEQQERYPQVAIIKFKPHDRIDVPQLDNDVDVLDDLGKKNLIVALAEVKDQVLTTAEKQSNKIAATRRYNKVLETAFGDVAGADLGLGNILEKKNA